MALPPTLRLRARSHFAALFDRGSKFHGRRIVVRICPNGGKNPRLGVGISKKRVRLAVARNRIRRAFAAAFADAASDLPPVDMLVSVKEDADKNDGKRLAAELRFIFPRIRKYVARHAAQAATGEPHPNDPALPSPPCGAQKA